MNIFEDDLYNFSLEALDGIGERKVGQKFSISWNFRMRSAAGRAKLQTYEIEINPKLIQIDEKEVWNTVLHELAHLVAWKRNRHRGHGQPWRQACIDLGIPLESVTHTLPLPSNKMRKKWQYKCGNCGATSERVRRAQKKIACAACCKRYNKNRYTDLYQLEEYKLI